MKLYLDYKQKVEFPIFASYKYDGIFAVVKNNRPYSKDGNEFKTIEDIDLNDNTEGELYNHEYYFEDIVSAVKKKSKLTDGIKFYPHEQIPKVKINDENELYCLLDESIKEGYEGLVLDTNIGKLKLKPVYDSEFEIIDIIEGHGKLSGKAGKLVFSGFSAGILGTHSYLEKIWNDRNNIRGKYATVQYQNMTKSGIPRFPKVKSIRDYE